LIIAHSLGAYAALAFLTKYPDSARGVVLLDGGGRLNIWEQIRIYIMLRLSFVRLGRKFKTKDNYLDLIRNSPLIGKWTQQLEEMLVYDMEETPDGFGLNLPPRVIERELNDFGASLRAMTTIRNALKKKKRETHIDYSAISIPVLLLRAGRRNLFPGDSILTRRAAAAMIAEISDARLTEVPANLYSIVIEEQPLVNEAILSFAERLSRKTKPRARNRTPK